MADSQKEVSFYCADLVAELNAERARSEQLLSWIRMAIAFADPKMGMNLSLERIIEPLKRALAQYEASREARY